VIGDGRYRLPDLVEQRIAYGDLTWNFRDRESNYLALRRSALSLDAGYSFVTTFAKQAPFDAPLRAMATKRGLSQGNLADLYFAQAAEDDDRSNDCGNSLPKLLEAPIIEENWEASSLPGSGALVCNGYSDLAAALVGLRPARAWLTRLELNLPKYALSMDCVVQPHEIQDEVSGS
jgi:hypothetical protein